MNDEGKKTKKIRGSAAASDAPRFDAVEVDVEREDGSTVPFEEYMTELRARDTKATRFEETVTYDRTRLRPVPAILAATCATVAAYALFGSLPWLAGVFLATAALYAALMAGIKAVERIRVIQTTVNGKTTVKVIPHSELKDDERS